MMSWSKKLAFCVKIVFYNLLDKCMLILFLLLSCLSGIKMINFFCFFDNFFKLLSDVNYIEFKNRKLSNCLLYSNSWD